jgi:hypothetical protein
MWLGDPELIHSLSRLCLYSPAPVKQFPQVFCKYYKYFASYVQENESSSNKASRKVTNVQTPIAACTRLPEQAGDETLSPCCLGVFGFKHRGH